MDGDITSYVKNILNATNEYMDILNEYNPFRHQADFTSSIIPEMFFLLMNRIISKIGKDYVVSAQSDVPIECMFGLKGGSKLLYKSKRLDMLVFKRTELIFDSTSYPFIIPIVAMEIKTNLDKNMMAGIEHSVESLKKTFPNCLYYVVTEFSDMALDKLNYASSDIDEIYIIRKQKRASVRNNKEVKHKLDYKLVLEIINSCIRQIESVENEKNPIADRMQTGKLIN